MNSMKIRLLAMTNQKSLREKESLIALVYCSVTCLDIPHIERHVTMWVHGLYPHELGTAMLVMSLIPVSLFSEVH